MRTGKRRPIWKTGSTAFPLLLICVLVGPAAAQPGPVGPGTPGPAARSDSERALYFPDLAAELSLGWRMQPLHHHAPARSDEIAVVSAFRERSEVLLGYDTPVRLGDSDLLFKLRAPGRRQSIVTLEVIF